MKRIRIVTAVIMVLSILSMGFSAPDTIASRNPGVLPPFARVQGVTLGEWSGRLWQVITIPEPNNPIFHPIAECYFDSYGNVGVATFFFESGSSNCTVPAGMMLDVLVISYGCFSVMGDGDTEEELHACAESVPFENLQASIDGIPISNIESYAATSPLFTVVFPEDNIFNLPAGPSLGVAHGITFITTPLSPGQHTIHVHGEAPVFEFVYDWTYNITVTQ
jgi:hypothetical protein